LPDVPEDSEAKGRLRRTRDALLLELGALVYELHRQGKRAPELLQQKAGELGEVDERVRAETPDAAAGPGTCPDCGAETEPGQLVCTNCGIRLALGGPPPARKVGTLAAVAVIVVLGAAASGFALSELTSDDGDGGGGDTPAASQTPAPAAAAEGEPQDSSQTEQPADTAPEPAPQRRSLLLDWPDDLTAHTVVLVTTSDRPAALRLARQAARSGIEAGLLSGEDYNLGAGLWVVFAGRFDSPEGASQQASDLAERFPGAYPKLVEPAG
jgi:hypothetical protein